MMPVLSLLIGAGLWGVIWYPLRLLEARGLSGIWLTLLIYAAAWAASLPVTARRLPRLAADWRLLGPLALAGGWTNVAFLLAILDGNVMRVLLLFYLSPVWAVVLGWLWLGERVSGASAATLVLAMSGAMLILWQPALGLPWPEGRSDWLALSAGFAFALSNVLVRKGQGTQVADKAVAVWLGVMAVAIALIIVRGAPPPALTVAVGLGVVAVGVCGILVMTVLVQYGVTRMPVHRSAVILLFELVTGAVSQQLLTNEVMTPLDWAGGALIVGAAWLSARL